MTAQWTKQEGNEGKLTITIPKEDVKVALDEAFKKVRKTLAPKGFRKGKLPRQIFNQMYGEASLYNDALDILLPKVYPAAIDEVGINPVASPNVDIEKIEADADWVISAIVTVKPEVKLGEYKGLKVDKADVEVSDEDVQHELAHLQSHQAELVLKEDAAAKGDTVVIDFDGYLDGEQFEGGKAENYSLELGSNSFIPGFEEQLEGKKAGENVSVNVTFPEDYQAEDLAGKAVEFKVAIHEVKTKEVPELDDELAKDIDNEVETLTELTEKVKARLTEDKATKAVQAKENQALGQAVENAEVDVPEVMIEQETEMLKKQFTQDIEAQGLTTELYFQFTGQTEEALNEQMATDAGGRVKTNLVLDAIAKAEGIEVTEEEVNEEVARLAEMYKMDVPTVRMALGDLTTVTEDLQIRKAVKFVVDNSVEA